MVVVIKRLFFYYKKPLTGFFLSMCVSARWNPLLFLTPFAFAHIFFCIAFYLPSENPPNKTHNHTNLVLLGLCSLVL